MAQFEIDIDLCLKDKRPFKIANASKDKRKCVMVSCLDELRWLSKSKLDLKPEAKVSIFLEKDGTEVDDQNYFEKLSEHTRLGPLHVFDNFLLAVESHDPSQADIHSGSKCLPRVACL